MVLKTYGQTYLARFIQRPNRFIAHCQRLDTGESVVVHVKNTGRCQELLTPDALVSLSYEPNPKRKTDYDLIAVKKAGGWVNIDSQVPNFLVYEGLRQGVIQLPGLQGDLQDLRREVPCENSKFDLAYTTTSAEKGFIEVKGMTLTHGGTAAFPDAPSLRGLKHVEELTKLQKANQQNYVLFVVQFAGAKSATIDASIQPELEKAVVAAQAAGVVFLAYECQVSQQQIQLTDKRLPFDPLAVFQNPNQ